MKDTIKRQYTTLHNTQSTKASFVSSDGNEFYSTPDTQPPTEPTTFTRRVGDASASSSSNSAVAGRTSIHYYILFTSSIALCLVSWPYCSSTCCIVVVRTKEVLPTAEQTNTTGVLPTTAEQTTCN